MKLGPAALAELLRQLLVSAAGDEDPEVQAERLWPAFRAAVAEALTELAEGEARGVAGWWAKRHEGADEGRAAE